MTPEDSCVWSTRDRVVVVALVTIAVTYIVSRAFGLDQSLWEDEMYTVNRYISRGWRAVFDPELYRSNNHPLYSLIGWLLFSTFDESEVLLRLVSVLPATAAAVLLGYWIWLHYGRAAGIAFAFLITLSPMHFEELRQARGWGLALLGATIVLVASLDIHDSEEVTWPHIAWFVSGALIGIWTIHALALPFAVHGILLLVSRRERWRLAAGGLVVAAASVIFYWPLRSAIRDPAAVRSREGASGSIRDGFVTFDNLLIEPFDRLITPVFDLVFPTTVALLIALLLAIGGATSLVRKRAWGNLMHFVLPLAVVFFGLALREADIWDRYVSFLLPHALGLTALGCSMVWSSMSRNNGRVSFSIVSLLALWMILGFGRFAVPIISTPQENFKGTAALIEAAAPLQAGYTHTVVSEFNFNLDSMKLEEISLEEFFERSCTEVGPAVFVDYPRRLPPADTSCLEQRGVRIVPSQRQSPAINVWFVP
jgi:hypothetical protein